MPVQIKVCGLTNLVDTRAAVEAGVDMLGFIFHPGSPRYIQPDRVAAILHALGDARKDVITVGVFVNQDVENIDRILTSCGLDAAQLHGEESPETLGLGDGVNSYLRGRGYKAIRPASQQEALALTQTYGLAEVLRQSGRLPAILLDTYHPFMRGGSGEVGDWKIAAEIAAHVDLLLAGGLNPDNIQSALRVIHPWGVDVSSGIEQSPGQKDHAALRRFVQQVRQEEVYIDQ